VINNRYSLYLRDCINLAKYAAIKIDEAARPINDRLRMLYPSQIVDQYDKSSWKYYRNIAGLYHPTDQVMTVTSLDDLTTIVFDKSAWAQHPQTHLAYKAGSRYYQDLVTRYPEQETLIRGVLYAPNRSGYLDEVIACDSATLLYYPEDLIEPTENDLPALLQKWIYNYYSTWVNPGYCITDDLYCAMTIAQVTLHMVPAIINLRLAACKTPQVHSYHIKEYLASHQSLDRYYEQLTRKQALFLYRNLPYIRNNAGRKEVFNWLVTNLMTDRGLPIYEYVIKHNTYVQLPDTENPNRLSYVPDLRMQRNALNYDDTNQIKALKSFDQLRQQMDSQAPGNENQRTYIDPDQEIDFRTHTSSVLATKVLESTALDLSDEVPHPLAEVLMVHWMAWAASGLYTAQISLDINGKINTTTLSAKDSVVLYQYCISKALGQEITYIQPVLLQRVLRSPAPDLTELQAQAGAEILTLAQIQKIQGYVPAISHMYTVDSFYNQAWEVFRCGVHQYRYWGTIRHIQRNAMAQVISNLHYEDKVYTLYTNAKHSDWLQGVNVELDGYSPKDYLDLATLIFDQATGMSAHAQISIKQVQRAMLAILTQLTSYSVQYLSDIDASKVKMVNNPVLCLSAPDSIRLHKEWVEIANQDIYGAARAVTLVTSPIWVPRNDPELMYSSINNVVGLKANVFVKHTQRPQIPRVWINRPLTTIFMSGSALDSFNALTADQKSTLTSIY
jgi:hypothetical protein